MVAQFNIHYLLSRVEGKSVATHTLSSIVVWQFGSQFGLIKMIYKLSKYTTKTSVTVVLNNLFIYMNDLCSKTDGGLVE